MADAFANPNRFGDFKRRYELLREVGLVFLKLGTIAFGGPAAHIAMMEAEFVQKRQWLDRSRFLDLVGAANLIPGPTSTELAIYLGYLRAGWPGLALAGLCFILPAMLIVMFFAHLYVSYGALPQISWALYGIKPVIIAIIILAVWNLGRAAVKDRTTAAGGIVALGLAVASLNPLVVLVTSGFFVVLLRRLGSRTTLLAAVPLLGAVGGATGDLAPLSFGGKMSLATLFLLFLKTGAILYGSGYVLLAFLWSDFVDYYQVLTDQQLLDAVAVGQFTPGPVFTTATFIGFVVAGVPGAIVSTIAIFLPSFLFVPMINLFLQKVKSSRLATDFLAGVIVASLALMAMVTWSLAMASIIDWLAAGLAGIAFFALAKFRVNSTWLILGGGLIGLIKYLLS
ncbi:MAG: chromate efflux transporter [Negativicutes bacterium]|nr:chromate efflux transporter [Negativicutes bacterium]